MSLGLNVLLIFIFLLLGSVFSGTELALVSLRGSQIEQMEQEDARGAKVAKIARDPNTFLSTVQIGVTLCGFLSASFGASSISPYLIPVVEGWGVPTGIAGGLVNIVLNRGLQSYGGDLYVGSMTIMQSVMQMLVMPIQGITQGAQPIMSYNYGAKNYSRVRKTFSLLLKVMLLVTVSGFALAALLPGVLARMFTQDAELIEIVKKMMPIFFGGIWAFGAQMACQTTFMALGQAKISLFLALLRKVVLLVPLALLLPVVLGGNVLGIYIAEPVADVICPCSSSNAKRCCPTAAHPQKENNPTLIFKRRRLP